MRAHFIIAGHFILAGLGVMLASGAGAAQQLDSQQIAMIIIATSGSANSGTGVQMTRLSFPSLESCMRAAKILEQDIRGGFVTARCIAIR